MLACRNHIDVQEKPGCCSARKKQLRKSWTSLGVIIKNACSYPQILKNSTPLLQGVGKRGTQGLGRLDSVSAELTDGVTNPRNPRTPHIPS
jgi:hypothetical protein